MNPVQHSGSAFPLQLEDVFVVKTKIPSRLPPGIPVWWFLLSCNDIWDTPGLVVEEQRAETKQLKNERPP